MFFYVYLQPEVISVAQKNGALGLQVLISILRGFLQNCCLAEFENYRVQPAIAEKVERLDDNYDRKIIKELFRVMEKRNRFIYCLPNHEEAESEVECAKDQAEEAMLDLLLLVDEDDEFEMIEVATLFDYQHSEFEVVRSKLVAEGLTLAADALAGKEMLDRYLKKALRYASSIVVCDRLFGEKYAGNYEYSAKVLFQWLEQALADPASCAFTFHCGEPDPDAGARDLDTMRRELTGFKVGRLVGFRLKLQLYGTDTRDFLPHQRFIITDQLAIAVDPGMDFMNPRTGRN